MRTVQMTLDDDLVRAVDRATKKLKTTRSAFTRDALRRMLTHLKTIEAEELHRRGYEKFPVSDQEFSVWESEQDWGDA